MTTQVKTADLLKKLVANRDAHIADVEAADKTWIDDMCNALRKQHKRAIKKNLTFSPSAAVGSVRRPQMHRERYDRAIAKLEWEQRTVLDLDDATFQAWVCDEWFGAVNGTNISSGAITLGKITNASGFITTNSINTLKLT